MASTWCNGDSIWKYDKDIAWVVLEDYSFSNCLWPTYSVSAQNRDENYIYNKVHAWIIWIYDTLEDNDPFSVMEISRGHEGRGWMAERK